MYFFTADEHYGHKNIIKYCNRPFKSVEDMDEVLVLRHNRLVDDKDTVFHLGDFTLRSFEQAQKYIKRLNGEHIFLNGSHDYWARKLTLPDIIERKFNECYVVMCHYAMRTWPRSHYGSWQLYGHSHGTLDPIGKQWDVGVDNNNFTPISIQHLCKIM